MKVLMESTNTQANIQHKQKNVFIPFQKERDSIGRIIHPKINKKSEVNALKMFENLKKSTKEYFFEKQYEKMVRKFKFLKQGLKEEEKYGVIQQKQFQEILKKSQCFSKSSSSFHKITSENPNKKLCTIKYLNQVEQDIENCFDEAQQEEKQDFFIDLQFKINQRMEFLKNTLRKKGKFAPIDIKQHIRISPETQPSFRKKNSNMKTGSSTKFMETFCSQGKKYRHLVDEKKFDPWKKWYKTTEVEIFPGEKIKMKKLEKSIYD